MGHSHGRAAMIDMFGRILIDIGIMAVATCFIMKGFRSLVLSRAGSVSVPPNRSLFSTKRSLTKAETRRFSTHFNNGGHDQNEAARGQFMTLQKNIVFPPEGTRPLFLYALLVVSMAAADIYTFYGIRNEIDDAARRAKSGEMFFGPSKTAKALLVLDDYIRGAGFRTYPETNDFPNFVPRIFRAGGLDAIRNGLQSSHNVVVLSAANLARTISARPKAAALMMEDDGLRKAIVNSFKNAVDAKVCEDCGGSLALQLFPLLEVIGESIPFYPFGKDPESDEILKSALEKFSQRAAHYTLRSQQSDNVGPLLIEPFPPKLPSTQETLAEHDPHWFLAANDYLLKISLEAAYRRKAKPEQILPIIVEPTLLSLNMVFSSGFFDEEQTLCFGLLCMQVLPHSKGFDPTLAATFEYFSKMRTLSNRYIRRLEKGFLDNFEFITTAAFAGAFGYIWGVTRTLFALRNVQPPVASSQLPSPSPPVKWADPRAWRWMMSRTYGGRAALGAVMFTAWHDFISGPLGWNVWVESDSLQVGFELVKAGASIVFTGALLKHTPFFFFPAFVAYLTRSADINEESVELSIGPWPRSTKPRRRGEDEGGGSDTKWT